jgi:hypothetical protein
MRCGVDDGRQVCGLQGRFSEPYLSGGLHKKAVLCARLDSFCKISASSFAAHHHQHLSPRFRALSSPPWFATPQRRSTLQSPQRHVAPTSASTSKTPARLPRRSMASICKRPFRTSTTSANTSKPSPSGDSRAASDARLKERSLALILVSQLSSERDAD